MARSFSRFWRKEAEGDPGGVGSAFETGTIEDCGSSTCSGTKSWEQNAQIGVVEYSRE
eukprot:CAMPEP_0170144470 /NCGR_PEP_ID=MMETSP0033_2-20121228/13805_1 /TAXON_ID=195969 /ORGANISM="Dolichomastix tenuilepis, Strain CCMP3274" /LENGTH=57 /DNA_ID=CAMNT_0010380971 /DNA_START=76 /DNA_END=249 /DNA_ORIENTATION=-